MTEVLMWHSKKPRRSQLRGFSIPFWVGGLIPRLATSYELRDKDKHDISILESLSK